MAKDKQKRNLGKTSEVKGSCFKNGSRLDFSKIKIVFVLGRNDNPLNPCSDTPVEKRLQELVDISAHVWRRTQEEANSPEPQSRE